MTSAQVDLFSPSPVRPVLGAVIYGLSGVRGLGEKALGTLFDLCEGRLEQLWEQSFESVLQGLKAAHIPQAEVIATRLWEERDPLLEQGLQEHTRRSAQGISVLARHELPLELRVLPSPPRWLFLHGDVTVLFRTPAVAVVETRRASEAGIRATRMIVQQMSAYDLVLVSGLADGIDHEAHRSSLNAKIPNVAFLGHGLDVVFPQETAEVRTQIVQRGGVVASEYLPGTMYSKSSFVQRNRLQAGLADAVIAVEADAKSGTAHTVRFAFENHKKVVGVQFHSPVPDIASLVARGGGTVISLDSAGLTELDRMLQQWMSHRQKKPDPIGRILSRLLSELDRRYLSPSQSRELHSRFISEIEHRNNLKHAQNPPTATRRPVDK